MSDIARQITGMTATELFEYDFYPPDSVPIREKIVSYEDILNERNKSREKLLGEVPECLRALSS